MQPNFPKPSRLALSAVALLCLLAVQHFAFAQTADSFNPAPNNQPFCMAIQSDDKILVGGGFTTIAESSQPYLARLIPDGTRDTNFTPTVNGAVTCIVLQPDGKMVLGGSFTQVDGVPLSRIARLNADGTLDTNFNATADSTVQSLALQPDGKIVTGGFFAKINGTSRQAIARLNSDGTVDSTFLPVLTGSPHINTVLVQSDGKVVVGGSFTVGSLYTNLARFTSTGATDVMPSANSTVNALALQGDGKLLVGTAAISNALIRITTNATVDTTFQATNMNGVYSIQPLTDGSVLLAAGGGVMHVSGSGVRDTNFNSFANFATYALSVQGDGKILAAGAFTSIAHTNRSYFARLNNPNAVSSVLTFDGNLTMQWARYGASAEVQSVTFSMTTDGTNWTDLGAPVRFGSAGWVLPNPLVQNAIEIRARACVTGGTYNGSSSQLEQVATTGSSTILLQPSSYTVNFGAAAQFSVSGGGMPASFQWYKDGNALTDDARISGTQSTTLTVANCSGADNGSYFVVLSNSLGTVTSSNAALSALDPLIISTSATNGNSTSSAGSTITYTVSAIGTALTYQWLMNSSPIVGATKTNLVLRNVSGANAGTYSVVVSSQYASITNVIMNLHVTDPFIIAQPSTSAWNLGRPGMVSVTVGGNLPISYQWSKNGVSIPGATTSSLIVTNVQLSDAGSYSVVASNLYGTVTSLAVSMPVNTSPVDSFNPGVGYPMEVDGLALDPANNIYVSGSVNVTQNSSTNMFIRLDPGGHANTNFVPTSKSVTSISIEPKGTILAGGGITAYVKRLDSTGAADGTLDAEASGTGRYVWGLRQQSDGTIIAAGWFTNLANETHSYVARINPDNSIDHSFTAYADSAINTAALLPNGKILLGGNFNHLNGQFSPSIGRLNSDGTTDYSFNGSAYTWNVYGTSGVDCLLVQPDGKIVVGGLFTNLSAHACTNLGRINSDGSFDDTFHGNAPDEIFSLALQADGKILVGGGYKTSLGSPVNGLARLQADGTIETNFTPNPDAQVRAIALQFDGDVIIGGDFTNVDGITRIGLARLVNPTPATESFSFDGATVTWLRGGSAPEVWRTSFEISGDGVNWTPLSDGTRVNGGWQVSGVPIIQPSVIRARGYYNTGNQNGSASIVESRLNISGDRTPPVFAENGGLAVDQNGFHFNIVVQPGQLVAVDRSTDLINWQPVATNLLSNGPFFFTDPVPPADTNRFYRLRLP